MAAARVPQKRILGESTNTRRNIPSSPAMAKKRKLEPITSSPAARFKSSQNGPKGKLGSSQPSHFESEVLEKMTQDIEGLKRANAEKDQDWARPSLADFNPEKDNLIFQQIEAEEGILPGHKNTVKLFGVTEVIVQTLRSCQRLTCLTKDWAFCYASRHRLPPLPLHCCAYFIQSSRLRSIQDLLGKSDGTTRAMHPHDTDGDAGGSIRIPGKSTKPILEDHSDRS
jgi:hypothetical protein